MVVNKTIEERKADDGSVYYSVVQTLLGPYDNSTGLNITTSEPDYPDTTTPDYELEFADEVSRA